MASHSQNQDEMITGINVTPMVDVMLVLLVIFMIAAPTLYQSGIKVDLPKATTGEHLDKVTLRFFLLSDSRVILDKKEISVSEVPELIKKAKELDPQVDAVVAADRSLSHGSVIEFVEKLKLAGIERFAVAVEGVEGSKK